MQSSRLKAALFIAGVALVTVTATALLAAQPVKAQCGSQASSCKNCHETQGQDPVNADGTGWHVSHAFGDFCYICHGGNNQATEAEAAHAGMVAPMDDVQAACAQCHPSDLQARSDVYTASLGIPNVVIGAASSQSSSAPAAAPAPAESSAPSQTGAPAMPVSAFDASDPNMVDYVARYNQEALHQQPTNWGNVILVVLLLGMVTGGLFLVNRREGWISVSLGEKKAATKTYSEDALGIADRAEKLNAGARKALIRLLSKPGAATDLLTAIDRLHPDDPSGNKPS